MIGEREREREREREILHFKSIMYKVNITKRIHYYTH